MTFQDMRSCAARQFCSDYRMAYQWVTCLSLLVLILMLECALEPISILLIEDSLADARLFLEALALGDLSEAKIIHEMTFAAALERLREEQIDVIVLDLYLPDSTGTSMVEAISALDSSVPILVVTGQLDEAAAGEALRFGAQDYLLKEELSTSLLTRAIQYAIERKRVQTKIYEKRREEGDEDYLSVLEAMGSATAMRVSRKYMASSPLKESKPAIFDEFSREYEALLHASLEAKAFKSGSEQKRITESILALANKLGYELAGPRDLVDVHRKVLLRVRDQSNAKTEFIVDEGRLLLIQLMGFLTSYYRTRSMG